jgi:hypothetical protein
MDFQENARASILYRSLFQGIESVSKNLDTKAEKRSRIPF